MPDDVIYIIDDDDGFRESAKWMLEGHGYEVKSYGEPERALTDLVQQARNRRVVILLDVRMPDMSGLELHNIINERGIRYPIIYLTGHGDVSVAVEAMSKGAETFLEKPVDQLTLNSAIESALAQPVEKAINKVSGERRRGFLECVKTLSKRETEVMFAVADGKSSLALAADLGISVKTVDMHRSKVLKKLSLGNSQQLTKMVTLCL